MPLPYGQPDFKTESSISLNTVRFFIPFIALLVVFLSLMLVLTPVFAAEDNSKPIKTQTRQVKKQESFFDKITGFIKKPFAPTALAQNNQKPTPAPKAKQTQQGPNLFQQIFNFFTAPFKALTTPSAPKKPTPAPKTTPQESPEANPAPESEPQGTPVTQTTSSTSPTAKTVTALGAGTTYVDLIGKLIIDSSGKIYPSTAALAETSKPSLGTSSNKFYGIFANNFSVKTAGLGEGIVKSSSSGEISAGNMNLSNNIEGTLGEGNGGTGKSTYTTGDMLYSSSTNNLAKLGIGEANRILTVSSGVPAWATISSVLGSGAQNIPLVGGSGTAYTLGGLFGIDTGNLRVGIGTTAPAAGLAYIQGKGTSNAVNLLTTDSSGTHGFVVLDNGNVGIGGTTPVAAFQIGSNLALSSKILSFSTSTGNLGIGTTTPGSFIGVTGNVGIGVSFANAATPSNGLAVSGNVGIGITTANSTLSVGGSAHIGSLYQGTAAPANGLFVDGNLGIGVTTSANALDIWGGAARVTGNITTDSVFLSSDGTALAPSRSFTADTNTGIFRPGADLLGFVTAGVDRLRIDANGNVGIGATLPQATLVVQGNVGIGFTGVNQVIPSNGLAVSGNVGIGITTANSALTVNGGVAIGDLFNVTAPTRGLLVQGTVGLGTTAPGAPLSVSGAALFGTFSNLTAPANGLAVSGNVGIGISTANSTLSVGGSAHIGSLYQGTAAPANGLFVDGNVGIGATTSNNILDVWGNVGIGQSLTVTSITVANGGLNVSGFSNLTGNVGVGNSLIVGNVGRFGGLSVSGVSTLTDSVGVGSSLTVTSGVNLLSGLSVIAHSGLATLSTSGNTGIGSSLTVTSGVSLASSLNVSGNANLSTLNTSGNITNAGVYLSSAGSVSAPAYAFTLDPDTGVYNPGANLFGLSTNGVDRLRIDANGNVGIGATLPQATLVVQGNVGIGFTGVNQVIPSNGLAVSGNVGIGITTANSALTVNGGASIGLFNVAAPTNGLLVSGNVGVGFSTPTALFHLLQTASANALRIDDVADDSSPFIINADGNVGIGATTASNPLDVWGNSRISGTLALDGILTGNSALRAGDGTALAPGLSFSNDTDSGLWRLGANQLVLSVNANPHAGFTMDASGNVGIGSTASIAGSLVVFSGNVGIGASRPNSSLTIQGNLGIGFTGVNQAVPNNGLAVSGNVGIGVTTANSNLAVSGNAVIGAAFAGIAGPSNGLLVEGRVGIGTTAPGAALSLGSGLGLNIGGNYSTIAASSDGIIVEGNVGIGASLPNAKLAIQGSVGIGFTGATQTPPANGLLVRGNVGIGNTTANAALHVIGNGTVAALFENGNVGIGTSAPGFAFVVGYPAQSGQFVVDSGGNVGIGVSGPSTDYKLDVGGKVRATGFNGRCNAVGGEGCNQDVAEVYISSEDVAPGDVLAFDSSLNHTVKKSQGSYAQNLIGIVSTSPGLILGLNGQDVALGGDSSTYGLSANPRKPAVALSGKVPVKVSTENGPIKVGDYLTSSSQPGVAMRATKAGIVVGEALDSYSGEGNGTVFAFVKLGYFNGISIAEGLDQDALGAESVNFSELVLTKLLSERATLPGNNASELLTDRIAAGVEVITPQLTADNVITGFIRPLEGKDLTLALGENQGFNITNRANETVISFDNEGNAYFKGRVVAASVKADQIEGLRVLADAIFTSKISSLVDQKLAQAQTGEVAGVSTEATLSADILVKLNADGGLTVGGPAEFKGPSVFAAVAEFISNVIFRGDVNILGRIFLPKDSAGQALIRVGSDSVTVSFSRGYDAAPTVNVTPTMTSGNDGAGNSILTGDVRFVVQGLSGSGFTIKLNKAASADMTFSWTALAQSNQFTSTQPASAPVESNTSTVQNNQEPAVSSEPAAEPTPTPEVEPTPTPTISPEPTEEASASATTP